MSNSTLCLEFSFCFHSLFLPVHKNKQSRELCAALIYSNAYIYALGYVRATCFNEAFGHDSILSSKFTKKWDSGKIYRK